MTGDGQARGGGMLGLFARHPTAANLLMAIMMISGIFALTRLNTQFFPDFGIDVIRVTVEWPGASAEDVDSNIVQAVDPEVRFLDGVKQVQSSSVEGLATIVVEYHPGSDMQAALADIETAVGQVTTLPEDSEAPEIRRVVRYDTIARLLLSGPYSEGALKGFAKRMRDDLLDRGIDRVDLSGARDEEIWVEISPDRLMELDLTLGDVASRIREISQDLPSGDTTGASERQVRSLGLVKDARQLGQIEIRALPGGEKVYLRDIADVNERFDERGVTMLRDGENAVELHVQRAVTGDALDLADRVDAYLETVRGTLPPNLRVEAYDVQSDLIRGRVDLLVVNGLGGLVIVLIVLFLFLNTPTAFWVAVGIPTSIFATLFVMYLTGQTINMVSLFGLIMALGIVVDDAIVVGEHTAFRARQGEAPLDAAVNAARRMAAPVVSSSLTTVAAFMPLLVIGDIIGDIIRAIPLVVITVIFVSLFECFLVLPGHLRWALGWAQGRRSRPRVWFNRQFDRFRDGPFSAAVQLALRWRYATLALTVGALVLSGGLVAGGQVAFNFFPSPEADRVYANVEFPAGSPRERTEDMLQEVDRALVAAVDRLTGGAGGLVRMKLLKVGASVGAGGGQSASGDHVGGLVMELVSSDARDVRTAEILRAWRAEVRPMAGLDKLTIRAAAGGPPGREIDVRFSGDELEGLKAAANEVAEQLGRYPGVSDITDDLPYGKWETILEVSPQGRAFGFTTESVGREVRNAFQGAIASRFARGDEEVTVRVRFPRGSAATESVDDLYLRGPEGAEVRLEEVVDMREKQGFSIIRREDGSRQVAVTADVDEAVTNSNEVLRALQRDGVAGIAERHEARVQFKGKAEEQAETLGDMRQGLLFGLAAIYIILAWVFSSYTRPLVVMTIIPFGVIGAIVGHWVLGYDLTILSLTALLGLSGIVVNDSIILVSTIDERVGRGEPLLKAIAEGSRDRLRAVVLTSATTIGGLTPLLFERSLQAQFLIPMAVTIVFGLLFATVLVLLVVPVLTAIQGDFAAGWARIRRGGNGRRDLADAEGPPPGA